MFRLDSVKHALLALVASVLVISGCRPAALFAPLGAGTVPGAAPGAMDAPAPRMASLLVRVQWPKRDLPGFQAASIPTTTNTLVIKVTGSGRDPVIQQVSRPAGPATDPVVKTIDIPEGNSLTVEVKAYREQAPVADSAVAIAQGTAAIPQALAGKMVSVPITLTSLFAPTITKLSAYGAPTGYYLTVTGTNFGSSTTPMEVKFNGTDPVILDPAHTELLTRSSTTQFVVRVPAQAVTGPIMVTADGIPSEENTIFWKMGEATLQISANGNYQSIVLGAGATAPVDVEQNISYKFPPLKTASDYTGQPGRLYSVDNSAIATVSVGVGMTDSLKGLTSGSTKITAYVGSVGSNELSVAVITGFVLQAVAGRGGGIGDGGSAAAAELLQPLGIAVTAQGDLLVADQGHSRIRRLGATATTEAGSSALGYVNGPALEAKFSFPAAVALDASGSLYVADQGNSVIRKVQDGVVTTVAGIGSDGYGGDGGIATSSILNFPQGVAITPDGHVVIADTYNHKIRILATSDVNQYGFAMPTGTIWTLAGQVTDPGFQDGSRLTTRFNTPTAVAVDASGSVYVADSGNHRVRKITAAGIVSTLGGTGTAGFGGDAGPATAAFLYTPSGIAVDASGSVYVADTDNNRVRVITTDGNISTLAGTGANSSSGDDGPASAAAISNPKALAVAGDALYISEFGTNRIRKVVLSTGIITTVAGLTSADGSLALETQLSSPRGVTLDPAGKLVIVDTDRNLIRRLNDDGTLTVLAGSGVASDAGDGGDPTKAGLNQPMSARYSDGILFIVDGRNGKVRAVGGASEVTAYGVTIPAGKIVTVAGGGNTEFFEGAAAVGNTLRAPVGVAFTAAGDMLVTDENANAIYMVAKSGGLMTRFAGGQNDAAGFLNSSPLTALLRGPRGIFVDSDGSIVFVDGGNHAVRRIKDNLISTVAGSGVAGFAGDNGDATNAQLNSPWEAASDGGGGLYITDGNNAVRWVTAGGSIMTVAGIPGDPGYSGDGGAALAGKLSLPKGIVRTSAGIIYFADTGNHRIRKLVSQ